MNATRHIDQEDLALFALQLMSAEEMAAAKAHLDECPECRGEVAALQGSLAEYAYGVEMETPAAHTRERLMGQIAREKKVVSIAGPAGAGAGVAVGGRRSGIGGRVLPWLGWAVAAGLTIAVANLHHESRELGGTVAAQNAQLAQISIDAARARLVMETMTDQTAMRVTLSKPQTSAAPLGRATYLPAKGSLVFIASNLAPLQVGKIYELWLIPANGGDSLPAGTFRPDAHGNANVILPDLPKGVEAKAFGVTIEAEGGSPTPTLPIILVGA